MTERPVNQDNEPCRPEGRTTGRSVRAPRVLLAEDDNELRALLARALRKQGYEVTEYADGMDLMEFVTSLLAHKKPMDVALVISDIRMPWVTGLEVLRGMHQYIGYPPMILITAFGDDQTHAQAEQLGAAAMFDKPFAIEELLAKAREIIAPRNTTAKGETL